MSFLFCLRPSAGGFEPPLPTGSRREWGSPTQTIKNCLCRASNAEREPKKRAGERRAATIEAEGQGAALALKPPKTHPRNQKRFHSRYNFGYGILLYIRKMPIFRPLTAHFGGSRGVFLIKPIIRHSLPPVRQKWRILYRSRVQSFKE